MKTISKYISFFALIFAVFRVEVFTQTKLLSTVVIDSVTLVQSNALEFTIKISRLSDNWKYFANATFQFDFDSTGYNISPDRHKIELIPGTSDLNIISIPGVLPTISYIVTPNVWAKRFSITVAGPETFDDCIVVPQSPSFITVGKFRISTKDGSTPPTKLRWLEPYLYYQALAYKIDRDSVFVPFLNRYNVNDNIEMDDGERSLVSWEIFDRPKPVTKLKYFDADYIGLKRVSIRWETESEAYVDGFIVVRGIRTSSESSPEQVIYKDTIADFRRAEPQHSALKGLGTSSVGKQYSFDSDTVEYRGFEYCYKLIYQDFFGTIHTLAYDCERIPNSIITKATPSPNPFSSSTRIHYIVEDDVHLDAFVSDLTGRIVTRLISNEYTTRGQHFVDFLADYNAQEGLYNVVFIAYPIDDPTVEISRAVVKLQLIR